MKELLSLFGVGLLFGAGLIVAGMTQADKVIGFLDVGGAWDPSLAFVMGGAIAVHLVLFRLILRRESPLLAARFAIPTRRDIDPRLVLGAATFGAGWGVGGYCPGPGLVAAGTLATEAMVFLGAMTLGMAAFHAVDTAWTARQEAARDAALG